MLLLKDLDLKGKKVFLRVDFNVPLDENRNIRDDSRIQAAMPTINYLLEQGAGVVTASHFGRPKGRVVPEMSLKPTAVRLAELVSREVFLAPDVIGPEVHSLKKGLKQGEILMLENLRFYRQETENDDAFAQELARDVDYFVNDAFGACHRAHASVVGVPKYCRASAAGFLVSKEVEYLHMIIRSPKKPYIAILGGAKVSDKIPVIKNLMKKADEILIGGAMAYTFLASQGFGVGRSKVEDDQKELAQGLLRLAEGTGVAIELPIDHVIAENFEPGAESRTIKEFPFPENFMALDIGPETVARYSQRISAAHTIFWNGPMGVFEIENFAAGTRGIARAVAESAALSIVGGGDSVAAISQSGMQGHISHISTGGGASLEFLANETLPGIEALSEK